MTRTPFSLAVALAALVVVTAPPGQAQQIVYDPTNYGQNVLQAARALEAINNQITSLQNEAQMLIGQARNLASLPYSSLAQLQGQVDRTRQLLGQAERLAYDVGQIDQAFTQGSGAYGAPATSATERVLIERARGRWADQVAALQDGLKLQAEVVGGFGVTSTEMARLVTESQSAQGGLQAAQAGNQLVALQSAQLAELTAIIAAQGRAQALEAANRAAERADAQARFRTFMGSGPSEPR